MYVSPIEIYHVLLKSRISTEPFSTFTTVRYSIAIGRRALFFVWRAVSSRVFRAKSEKRNSDAPASNTIHIHKWIRVTSRKENEWENAAAFETRALLLIFSFQRPVHRSGERDSRERKRKRATRAGHSRLIPSKRSRTLYYYITQY